MIIDPIADLLTRMRNAQMVGHPSIVVSASKLKRSVLEVLVAEGYIHSFKVEEVEVGKPQLRVQLKYDDRGSPVIKEIHRLSSPGRRAYVGCEEIPQFRGGLGTVIVSTSRGVMSGREAERQGVGGELICSVF